MKIKVAGVEVELKDLENGYIKDAGVAEKLFSLGADGKTTNPFDKGTQRGVVTIGKNILIAFLEDESGLVVPFYWDRGRKTNNARIGDRVSYTKKTDSVTVRTGTTGGVSIKVDDPSRDALTAMSDYYAGLSADDRDKLVQLRMDASKFSFGELFKNGIELTRTDGKKKVINGGLFTGPHAEIHSNAALYMVAGMSFADFKKMNLSQDQFFALVTKKDFGDVSYEKQDDKSVVLTDKVSGESIAIPAGVSVVGVKDAISQKNNAGDLLIRGIPHRSKGLRTLVDFWAPDFQYDSWKVADASISDTAGLVSKIDKWTPRTGGLGSSVFKSRGWVNFRTGVKHAVVFIALATVITFCTLFGVSNAQVASANQAYMDNLYKLVQVENKSSNNLNKYAYERALAELPDETEQAKIAARDKAIENASGLTLVGKQYADGTFDTKGLEEAFEKSIGGYVQQNGRKYTVTALYDGTFGEVDPSAERVEFSDGRGVAYFVGDEVQTVRYQLNLTDEEILASGHDYTPVYTIEYYKTMGVLAAQQAIKAGAPVLKVNQNGEAQVIFMMPYGSEEQAVAVLGSNATKAYMDGFGSEIMAQRSEGLIGAQGVEDDGKYLQSEAVLAAAAKVAGENAGVLAMQQEGEHSYVYIQSEDGKSLHRIEVSGDAKALASEIEASKGGKNDQVFMRATEYAKSVYPNLDEEKLAGIYDNTYVQLYKTTKNGVTTCTSTIANIGLDGSKTTIEVRDGHSCQASRANFRDSEAAVVAVDGADAAFNNLTKYTVDPPTSTAAAESGRDRA